MDQEQISSSAAVAGQQQSEPPRTEQVLTGKQKISSVGELLKQAIGIYRQGIGKFLGMLLLMPLLGLLPLLGVIVLYGITYFILNSLDISMTIAQIICAVLGFAAILILMYFMIVSRIGIFILLKDFTPELKVKEAFKQAKPYFWKFIIVSFAVSVFIMLWSLLFIIPGIIFAVYYSFAVWSLIVEEYESTSALKRSKELVKDYWWAVAGRGLAIGLIFWAIILILLVPLFFINEISFFSNIWSFVVQIIQIIISPIFIVYNYLIFRDLVNIKGKSQIERKKGGVGIVIAVLAMFIIVCSILAAIALLALNNAKQKAKDASKIYNIAQIHNSLKLYNSDHGRYPECLSDLVNTNFSSEETIKDPENDLEYKYTKITPNDYELCFELKHNMGKFTQGENCESSEGGKEKKGRDSVDTSLWQNYKSDEWGFELQYPVNWKLSEHTKSESTPFSLLIATPDMSNIQTVVFSNDIDFDDWVNDRIEYLKIINSTAEFSPLQDININGKTAKRLEFTTSNNFMKEIWVWIPDEDDLKHEIRCKIFLEELQYKAQFNQFIGSFKIIWKKERENADTDKDGLNDSDEIKYGTDPNNPDSDGDGYLDGDEVAKGFNPTGAGSLQKFDKNDFWKIYKDDEFEIKYPRDWEVKINPFEFDEEIQSSQVQFFSQIENDLDDFQEKFLINISISDSMTDIDELKKFHDSLIQDNILELFETTLANKPAYGNISIVDIDEITTKVMSVYTIANGKFYMVQYFVNALDDSSEFENFVEIAEEMIESFKLTM
ncbi:MAG: hypothetical protein U9M94_02310 [Patescibacteria group bacterium]|nr:hypothetical protein [Patescibacteria group bacterium]